MHTIKSLYNKIYNQLLNFNFCSVQTETEIILIKTLGITKTEIYTNPDQIISKEKFTEIENCLSLRLQHKPIAYIFKETEFFGLNFYVDENVLIPRQETELLVEESLNLILKKDIKSFADIGTGSGNIVVSIVKNIPLNSNYDIYATDISLLALDIAKKNSKLNFIEDKINFVLTDKLNYFLEHQIKLDLIVSNPPYVTEYEYKNLQPEIYYEPKLALVSPTGLEFYEYFAKNGKEVLNQAGYFVLEINSNLLKEIINIFEKHGFKIEKVVYDYQKLPRVIVVSFDS